MTQEWKRRRGGKKEGGKRGAGKKMRDTTHKWEAKEELRRKREQLKEQLVLPIEEGEK